MNPIVTKKGFLSLHGNCIIFPLCLSCYSRRVFVIKCTCFWSAFSDCSRGTRDNSLSSVSDQDRCQQDRSHCSCWKTCTAFHFNYSAGLTNLRMDVYALSPINCCMTDLSVSSMNCFMKDLPIPGSNVWPTETSADPAICHRCLTDEDDCLRKD